MLKNGCVVISTEPEEPKALESPPFILLMRWGPREGAVLAKVTGRLLVLRAGFCSAPFMPSLIPTSPG